jgi:hypothetical protein
MLLDADMLEWVVCAPIAVSPGCGLENRAQRKLKLLAPGGHTDF